MSSAEVRNSDIETHLVNTISKIISSQMCCCCMSLGGANVVHNKLATLFGGPSILGMCMGFMFEKSMFD